MTIQPIAPLQPLSAINSTSATSSVNSAAGTSGGAQKAATDFSKFLTDALDQVNALQKNADNASIQLAAGNVQDLSTVMIALQKANLSLSLAVSVRDKAVNAYNEIMRMQM
jgi:flagellar hook-basal body complex protein FliE